MNVYSVIAKTFYNVLDDVLKGSYTHYWLKGGRGSTKSSFVSIALVLLIMLDSQNGDYSNAVVLRKVGATLQKTVYTQIVWAIEKLGVQIYWRCLKSPLTIIYMPTGQEIRFESSANSEDYLKLKSTKFSRGYCKYIWYEELTEFDGMEEVRNINQSLMRGGSSFEVFYTYNPPKMVAHWVNAEVLNERKDRLVHSSTYLDVPKEWLGEPFFIEAETLKKQNELAYRNEYLGEATGTGGAIFTNLAIEEFSDEEIKRFDVIYDGVDFGYAVDPTCYLQMHYDKKKKELYIFNEIYEVGLSNKHLYEKINKIKIGKSYITCDSAEPRSIDELRSLGLRTRGARKGADSIEYGIKWLQQLAKIHIDKKRCPNATKEFSLYEYEKDKYGNFISHYPDANNHSIACTRYAMEEVSRASTWQLSNRKVM